MHHRYLGSLGLPLLIALAGCAGPQSALHPAGEGAGAIAQLFYWMAAGATAIWLLVIGLAVMAVFSRKAHHRATVSTLVIGGGVVFPTIVLTGLLCYALPMIPRLNAPAGEEAVRIDVAGVRWWWRVHYEPGSKEGFEAANEIVLPVGRPVNFSLRSEDVIHSFWIPALGGKIDMVPGRTTHLKLVPTREGNYRGVCAEYCGDSHAHMMFAVRIVSEPQYEQWVRQQQAAASIDDPQATRGAEVFAARGCSACHTIRGTAADGTVGPDLTHVGSRLSLAAGRLGNELPDYHRWIAEPDQIKPGVEMPPFGWLPPAELELLARYLEQLQ